MQFRHNLSNSDLNPAPNAGFKQKNDVHVARKLWHCLGITFMAGVYYFAGSRPSWMILLSVSAIVIPLDLLRQNRPGLNLFTFRIFGPFMRKHEANSISGMTYLFLGTFFVMALFSRHIVTLTLLFLAFGDPFASFCGIRFGKDRIIGNKTLQGTLGAFAICTMIAGLYYYFNNLMIERVLIVAPISGLIGALAELLPIGKLDDNLTIPILASCLLWLLFQVYGGFTV